MLEGNRPQVDKPGEAQDELCLHNTVEALGKGKPVRQGGKSGGSGEEDACMTRRDG